MFIGSWGFNGVKSSAEDITEDRIGNTYAITYVFQPDRFNLMEQAGYKGKGLC